MSVAPCLNPRWPRMGGRPAVGLLSLALLTCLQDARAVPLAVLKQLRHPAAQAHKEGPSANAGSGVTITCSSAVSGRRGRLTYTQYTCLLSNTNDFPILSLNMSCTNFHPVTAWNINADCTFPSYMVLYPKQAWYFGYSASQEASFEVHGYVAPHPDISVLPPTDPSSQLSLTCDSVGKPYISQGTFVYSYGCTVSNDGKTTVYQVQLKCLDFHPTLYSMYNINPDCSLTATSIGPAQTWSFGFQTTEPKVSFGIDTYKVKSLTIITRGKIGATHVLVQL